MRNVYKIACLLLMLTLGTTCLWADNSSVKLYKKIAIDELYGIHGIHEIDPLSKPMGEYYSVEFDSTKRPISVSHWMEGKICDEFKSGISITKVTYQPKLSTVAYFDANRQPVNNRSGFQSIHLGLDASGLVESCLFFDKDQQPANNQDGVFEIRCSHSSDGSRVIIFLDSNRKLMTDSHGRMCLKEVMDDHGQVIEQVNLDSMGKPTNNGDSVCTVRYTYDNEGQVLTRVEFESDPALVPDDYALTQWSYDAKGVVTSVQYSLMKVDKEKLHDPDLGYISRKSDFDDGLAVKEAKALWGN